MKIVKAQSHQLSIYNIACIIYYIETGEIWEG